MKYFRVCALLLIVALIGLGANGGCGCPGPGSVGLGRITGYVASAVLSTSRIPGATITATGGGKTYTTVTDDQGNYTLIVPAGTYEVSASKETFNTKTESGVSVTADETKTVNFSLTTGTGGTTDINVSGIGIYTITYPSQFDIRSIRLDKNLKPDIEGLLKSFPPNIRVDGTDYKSVLMLLAEFYPFPPTGTQGTRIYVGTTQNGPFVLKTLNPSGLNSGFNSIVGNLVGALEPNTTYYIYPSLYGTWGEVGPDECIEASTPDKLELTTPDNGATVYPGEEVTFEWTDLGTTEGWWYSLEVKSEDTGDYVFRDSTSSASYSITVPGGDTAGNYLWRVTGSRYFGVGSYSLSRQETSVSFAQISISYPRRLTVGEAPVDEE